MKLTAMAEPADAAVAAEELDNRVESAVEVILSEQRYETLGHKIVTAVQAETSQLDELRSAVSVLVPSNLQRRERREVASIATDGGDNAVTFGPLNLDIIRVVERLGRERLHELIAMSEDDSYCCDILGNLLGHRANGRIDSTSDVSKLDVIRHFDPMEHHAT